MPLNRPCVLTKSEAEVAVALNNELLDIAIEVAFSDNRVVNYQREALVAASKHRPTSLPCLLLVSAAGGSAGLGANWMNISIVLAPEYSLTLSSSCNDN